MRSHGINFKLTENVIKLVFTNFFSIARIFVEKIVDIKIKSQKIEV